MSEQFQSSVCKKCGKGGFYFPSEKDDLGAWPRIDKYNRVQAFEEPFKVPHWYICPADDRGKVHRQKMESEFTKWQQEELLRREKEQNDKKKPLAPGQQLLPSDKLSDIDRAIIEKIHVIDLLFDEIKKLFAQKV